MDWRAFDPRSISPEFAFVCACATPGDPPRLPQALDEDRLAAIAHRHQLVPLVVEAFAGSRLPAALAARSDPVAPLRMAREAIRLRTLLEAEGIAPVFLKGSSLAMLAYGAIGRRQFSDIDLLVDPADTHRAAMLLGEAGYRAPSVAPQELAGRVAWLLPIAKDIMLRHIDDGLVVELHWRMGDDPRERPAGAREHIQRVELAPGAALPTLGTEALFAYLCAHGASHGWARLRWLADVAGLLAGADDDGDGLWRGAVARGQARAAASAILLCARLFGQPTPRSFVRPVSLRLWLLLLVSTRVIGAGGGTTELARTRWRGWVEMTAKLLVASSFGDLVGWTTRILFSADDAMPANGTRWRYGLHLLHRIPNLVRRRRRRHRMTAAGAGRSTNRLRARR